MTFYRTTLTRSAAAFLLLWPVLLTAACEEDPNAPYVEIKGGGFIFNYRVADAYYGFVARRLRKLPPGTILEARFEDPSGGEPFVVTSTPQENQLTFSFRSPPLRGVKADRDYRVELRLLKPATGEVLATYSKAFQSLIDQDVMPEQPLTVGPGYHPNPEAASEPPSP